MIWLLSEFWVVGVVSLVSGFVVTWLLIVRRINVPVHELETLAVSAQGRAGAAPTVVPRGDDGAIGFDLSRRSEGAVDPVETSDMIPPFEWTGGSRD